MKINHIKVANHLPYGVEFQKVGSPLAYGGRQFQLCVGEKHIPFSKRMISFVKASLATICTGFIGLCFASVRKQWGKVFHSSRMVQRYIPVPSSIPPPQADQFNKVNNPKGISSSQISSQVGKVRITSSFLSQENKVPLQELQTPLPLDVQVAPAEEKAIKKTEISKKENEFDDLLEIIQQDAQRDLFLNDDYIDKKYGINSRLASLPEEEQKLYRAKLNEIINLTYLEQILRNKGKIVMRNDFENVVLGYLDYKMDNPEFQEKEAIYSFFLDIVQAQIKSENLKQTNASFRKLLDDYALEARLQAVKMTDKSQIAKFKSALSIVQNTSKKLEETANEVSFLLPPVIQEKAPLAALSLNRMFNALKSQEIRNTLSILYRNKIKENFFDSSIEAESFERGLKEKALADDEKAKKHLTKKCDQALLNAVFRQRKKFYLQWVPYLKTEIIQGYQDSNEILDKGICLALCFKLLEELQLKPEVESEKLVIEAIDRFKQALYIIKAQKTGSAEIPKEWLEKSVFQKEQNLFELAYDPLEVDLDKRLKSYKIMDSLKQSNGWISLHLKMEGPGHAVLMRLDQARQKAWLFDPNMGLLCFEADGKTFDQARNECLDCFRHLSSIFYPTLYTIKVNQLIPKETITQ